MIRYTHTNIVARDVERLANFYKQIFGCVVTSPSQVMTGDALSKGSGIPNVEVRGIWLQMPGFEENAPTLELFQYTDTENRSSPRLNEPGYSHIAFDVSDIAATADAVLAAGGSRLGSIADYEDPSGIVTFVFLRDPEGNIVELIQEKTCTHHTITNTPSGKSGGSSPLAKCFTG